MNAIVEYVKECLDTYFSNNPNILAVVLSGSASAGLDDELSDIDVMIVYENDIPNFVFPDKEYKWDVGCVTREDIAKISYPDWQANAFLTVKLVFDRTDWLENEINRIRSIPSCEIPDRIRYSLDGYYNAYYRSIKDYKRNNHIGYHMMCAESVRFLIECLYVYNGLIPPYPNRIACTADMLTRTPVKAQLLCEYISKILEGTAVHMEIELFDIVEKYFRTKGYGDVCDAWNGELHSVSKRLKCV